MLNNPFICFFFIFHIMKKYSHICFIYKDIRVVTLCLKFTIILLLFNFVLGT